MAVAVRLRGGGGEWLLKNVPEEGLDGLTFSVDFPDAARSVDHRLAGGWWGRLRLAVEWDVRTLEVVGEDQIPA